MAFVLTPTLSLTPAPRHTTTRRIPPPRTPKRVRTAPIPGPVPAAPDPLAFLHLAAPPNAPVPAAAPTSRPAPRTPAPEPQRRPVRKPHGYWNDLSNVERELTEVNMQLNRPPRSMPRLADLRSLSRTDLIAALSKHGGLKRVAETLRWTRGKTRRRTPDNSVRRDARVKTCRRPNSYWDDVERVKSEILAFVDEFGTPGSMPTRKQFYTFGRSDLVNAAAQHGGLVKLAKEMDLRSRRRPKQRLYWKDFSTLEAALKAFSKQHCPGRMPTGDELVSRGESAIANAISAHGGFREVADRCGLSKRGSSSQGAPIVWDERRLRLELHAFCMAYFPRLAREGVMPTERQLRSCGRNDLSYAIGKFGGFARVADMVGLKRKGKIKGPFQRLDGIRKATGVKSIAKAVAENFNNPGRENTDET